MGREQFETLGGTGTWRIFAEREVNGLGNSLGRFAHGSGPGPDGPQKPIPLFFQLLDPETFDLSFTLGDSTYEVLTADQKRFSLPRALPPVLALLLPDDDENPTGCYAIARYPYSEGAFRLLGDLLETGYRFSLKEFLRLSHTLASALEFLHAGGIAHGQWNERSLLCVPVDSDPSPLDEPPSYRFDLLNTGVRYRDPGAIPREYIDRGYFPREIFPPSSDVPDYQAFDRETDVYCFCAFLRDLFQRASRFEELTQQASTIRDFFYREAIRKGREPSPELVREKEQEVLDHLYTVKAKIEDMIQGGLRPRDSRASAAELCETSRRLHEKASEYMDRLFETGFDEPINVFDEELQHYVPYRVSMEPAVVNQLEDSTVTLTGQGLPTELIRVSLGAHQTVLDVEDASPGRIRFVIPCGFAAGTHNVLINNRRTNVSIEVVAPEWTSIEPRSARLPWSGFGNVSVKVSGRNLPAELSFALRVPRARAPASDDGASEDASGGPDGAAFERKAVSARRLDETEERAASREEDGDQGADAREERSAQSREAEPSRKVPDAADLTTFAVEFPSETPVGSYRLVANGLDTGLELTVEDALPEPVLDADGVRPREVLNHRTHQLELRGRNLHPSMLVDLGDDTPAGLVIESVDESGRRAVLSVARGFPAGEYTVRLNRVPTRARLVVIAPAWTSCEPPFVRFGRRPVRPATLTVRGERLPAIDPEAGDEYRLATPRGRVVPGAIVVARAVHEGEAHEVELSPRAPRGRFSLSFNAQPTGLSLVVRRKASAAAWAGAAALVLAALVGAGALALPALRPRITHLDTPLVYNFGPSRVEIRGARVSSVTLRGEDGEVIAAIGAERLEPAAGGDASPAGAPGAGVPAAATGAGGSGLAPTDPANDGAGGAEAGTAYAFGLAGVPPGRYELVPRAFLLDGEPAEARLTVLSPGFRLEPASVHRLLDAKVALTSSSGFPLDGKALRLERQAAGGGRSRAEPAPELALDAAGVALVPAGTFESSDEGRYSLVLDGVELGAAVTASGEPLLLEVAGPRVTGVEPRSVTVGDDDTIVVELQGERLPDGVPLGLRAIDAAPATSTLASLPERAGAGAESGARPIAFRLASRGGGAFEGRARPGRYDLAWDLGQRIETIPGVSLAVLPRPRVTGVEPVQVSPETPVRIEVSGVNLQALDAVSMRPLAEQGEPGEIRLDPARVSQDASARSSFRTQALVFKTGRYALGPGDEAVLDVIEDCQKLLDGYRGDLEGKDRLLDCLSQEYASEATRREAAGIFFDQGLFGDALVLYESLADLRSRFRAAFIRHFVDGSEAPGFRPVDGDVPQEPYFQAAAALGWVAGVEATAPSDPARSWELDFVRGHLATDPVVAVEALTLSIEKKRSAAVGREIAPFEPAFSRLAKAQLDLGIRKIARAEPLEAQDYLRKTFLEGNAIETLAEPDRAAFHFFYGHLLLWYGGDGPGAEGHLRDGMQPEGRAYASLCRLYLESLGAQVPPAPLLYPMLPAWERDFVTLCGHYRTILDERRYDLLTESTGFAFLSSEDQQASLELFKALERLEASSDVLDPFAHDALLYSLRNAQRLSWPHQERGQRAIEHRERLRALRLSPKVSRLRDFYMLQAEVEPLEASQIAVLPGAEVSSLLNRAERLLASDIPGSFKNRLAGMRNLLASR